MVGGSARERRLVGSDDIHDPPTLPSSEIRRKSSASERLGQCCEVAPLARFVMRAVATSHCAAAAARVERVTAPSQAGSNAAATAKLAVVSRSRGRWPLWLECELWWRWLGWLPLLLRRRRVLLLPRLILRRWRMLWIPLLLLLRWLWWRRRLLLLLLPLLLPLLWRQRQRCWRRLLHARWWC